MGKGVASGAPTICHAHAATCRSEAIPGARGTLPAHHAPAAQWLGFSGPFHDGPAERPVHVPVAKDRQP